MIKDLTFLGFTMDSNMEGPLSKWTNVMKGWQYRWFVLDDNAGLLSYYTSRDKMMRGSRRGCVRLCSAIIGIDDVDDSAFTITVDQKIFHFQARDGDEREQWVTALEDTIARHSKKLYDFQRPVGTLGDFDKKLSEADAYMKILIKNARAFERRINMTEDPAERQKYEGMQITAMELVESVKQAIVLLQVAKQAIIPEESMEWNADAAQETSNGSASLLQSESTIAELRPVGSQSQPDLMNKNEGSKPLVNGVDFTENAIQPQPTTGVGADSIRRVENAAKVSSSDAGSSNHVLPSSLDDEPDGRPTQDVQRHSSTVPVTSYSSSDEEDDEFYDADEEVGQDEMPPEEILDPTEEIILDTNTMEVALKDGADANLQITNLEISEDMYMQEEDHNAKEGESVEEHKSVIMHLLSQVKLGMDLTKVVLPTFILERRSLLEMYADFFAHPDLFVSIADGQSPADRMVSCLRWYLSSFHAGRKGSVAKKPYNPIQGESFRCFYNLPNTPPDEYKVGDGPVPWAHRNNVTFLAEQVSHHPPVSGFYAEHVNKQIQFNAHIWTKSKFLGLSIGVHNLGQGCVRLLDREEEYIMNFPNGYGRSILTVPWVELGGECTITCEKTGYSANVTFHTKPFYGGKVHKITSEVFAPNAKKPVLSIEGEWNGVMFVKSDKGKNDVFIDTKNMPTVTKVVKKIEHQGETESRRLWKDVTYNLKHNNIDEATAHKRKLEEKQRQDAKYRLENNVQYKTIYFEEDQSGNWIYKNPLIGRL